MTIDKSKISRVSREKVVRLARLEAERDKRGRLESVLAQKLTAKHGGHTSRPIPRKVIIQKVKSFLDNSCVVIEQTDIRNVSDVVDKISKKLTCHDSPPKNNANSAVRTALISNEMHPLCPKTDRPLEDNVPKQNIQQQKSLSDASPWTLMEAFKQIETGEIALAAKATTMKSKKDMAAALHQQIRLKEIAKKEREHEDQTFKKLQAQQLQEWQKMQNNAVRLDKEKSEHLRKVREEQIDDLNRRRRSAFDESRSKELEDIENLKGMLDQEERRKREQKEQERLRWKSIVEENDARKKQRQRQKDEEAAMDAKLMEDMKVKLDLEEAKRANAFAERMERNRSIGQQMTKAGAFKDRDKLVEMERKIMKEAQEKQLAEMKRETRQQEARQKKKELIMKTNMKMAEEKIRREKELEQAQEEYAIQCRRETETVKAEGEAKRAKRAATTKEYSRLLNNQIEEQNIQQMKGEIMTPVERSINKEILSKIENDPALQQKIAEKL